MGKFTGMRKFYSKNLFESGMLNKLVFQVFFSLTTLNSFAQTFNPGPISNITLSFERKVIASAGREAKNNTTLYSNIRYMTYTIGETVIHGGTAGTNRISNGFIQPDGIAPTSQPGTTAIEEVERPFAVYPNPFTDVFIIEAPQEQTESVRIQLIDANGKLLKEEEFSSLKHRVELPEGTAPGTYYVNFYTSDGTFLQQSKLVKMNAPQTNVAY